MESKRQQSEHDATPARRSAVRVLRDELRGRGLTYVVVVGFAALGPVLARMIFPEAPLSLILFGGITLGGFFAFCAIANHLFE